VRAADSGHRFFTLAALPERMSKKQIVRIFKERWRTERMYEDIEGELGPTTSNVSPPRPKGLVPTIRSSSRPERHFVDSFITVRLVLALFLTRWLPRCPFCHQPRGPSRCSVELFTPAA
jgi:hypothetical protein